MSDETPRNPSGPLDPKGVAENDCAAMRCTVHQIVSTVQAHSMQIDELKSAADDGSRALSDVQSELSAVRTDVAGMRQALIDPRAGVVPILAKQISAQRGDLKTAYRSHRISGWMQTGLLVLAALVYSLVTGDPTPLETVAGGP